MKFFKSNWNNLFWSKWFRFDEWIDVRREVSPNKGLYRIKPVDKNFLMYIGQTGRSLKRRINDLIRNSSLERMPFNDPHTAAPNLWAWSKTDSFQYEFSFTEFDKGDRLRITQESILLWLYRKEKGESTYCNFGRFNPLYTKSKNRSAEYIGRKLSKKREHSFNPSHKPLNDIGNPDNQKWMGLNWTPLIELNDFKKSEIPNSLGVYKILNSSKNLIYIGQSKKISNRLFNINLLMMLLSLNRNY